jgi:hypothetical protein
MQSLQLLISDGVELLCRSSKIATANSPKIYPIFINF